MKFSSANDKVRKLAKRINIALAHAVVFNLPSGWTCPGAVDCLSRADRETGKISDGAATQFRCFMASIEAQRANARALAWSNFDDVLRALRGTRGIDVLVEMLDHALPHNAKLVRIHGGGDFFSPEYFAAWCELARARHGVHFYAYSKSWQHIDESMCRITGKPANLSLTNSVGGKYEDIAKRMGIKSARVVYSEAQAQALGLEIDSDDYHAAFGDRDFALLLHGNQPAGSGAQRAWRELKRK